MSAGAVREKFSIENRVYYDALINLVKKYALEFCRRLGSWEMQEHIEKSVKAIESGKICHYNDWNSYKIVF